MLGRTDKLKTADWTVTVISSVSEVIDLRRSLNDGQLVKEARL